MSNNYCTIYIVRHGETDWNIQHLIQGSTDTFLNKAGEKQAKILGKRLKDIKFDAVYSSDLARAKRTAEIIVIEKKLAVETTKLLRERNFGKLEGKPWSETDQINQIWRDLDKQQRLVYRPYKGYETDDEIVSRLITFLREIAASRLGQTILVVSHGGLMRVLLNHLSDETFHTGAVKNSGYIKIKSDGIDFFLEELFNVEKPIP